MSKYPYNGINDAYYDKEFLDSVWNYLEKKSILWKAGIETPNPADRLAYEVLKQITMRKPWERLTSDSDCV